MGKHGESRLSWSVARVARVRKRSVRIGTAVAIAPLIVVALTGASPALASASPAGVWELDEFVGTTASDTSGNGNDGQAYNVERGVDTPTGTGYGFDGVSSKIEVPTSPSLNPGTADFSYKATIRFTDPPLANRDTYDVLRKGLSVTTGGEYKMEIANVNGIARARCLAKDSVGHLARVTLKTRTLADGQWHTITCTRSGSTFTTQVDAISDTEPVTLNSVDNSKMLTIGTKLGGKTGGDWYKGEIDRVEVDIAG